MYRLLIVDDEAASRNGLRACVDWRSLGVEICGEAINGKQALDMVRELLPDLVLSDVRMPFMDGIELCSQLKQSHGGVKLIFVSGYGDLDYLKSALRLGAEDYILKPVDIEELAGVVRKTIGRLEAERRLSCRYQEMAEKLMKSMPLLRERFFIDLVNSQVEAGPQDMENKLAFLDIPLAVNGRYCLILIKLYCEGLSEFDKYVVDIKAREFIGTMMNGKEIDGKVIQTNSNEFAVIMPFPVGKEHLLEEQLGLADDLIVRINAEFSIDVSVGVGKEVNSLMQIPESHRVAREALAQSYYKGRNVVLLSGSQAYRTKEPAGWDNEPALMQAIKNCDASSVEALFEQMEAHISAGAMGRDDFQALFRRILATEMLLLYDNGLGGHPLTQATAEMMGRLSGMDTLRLVHREIRSHLLRACSTIAELRESNREIIIRQIKDIIGAQLAGKLTINEIADRVHYSAAYISSLFKQESGKTINEYITCCRMSKAEEMMKDPSLKLYQIAEMVGYSDAKYFSRLFRRHTGVNPSEYRS